MSHPGDASSVVPALAADPIKLELRGYLQTFITAGHIDRDVVGTTGMNYQPVTFCYEGEIWFSGSTKLDNGTTVGVRVELEGGSQNTGISATNTTGTGDQLDEEYLFAFGDWGRIEFGATDAASYKMHFGPRSALMGWGLNDPTPMNKGIGFLAANHGGRSGTTTCLGASCAQNSGDANKLTYMSPRFAGLQVGVSYAPSFAAGYSAARCGFRAGGANFNNCPENNNSWKNAIDIAAIYTNKFGAITVGLYGSYVTAAFDRGALTPDGNVGAANNAARRWKSWAAGARITYGAFTLAGGLGRDNNGLVSGNTTRWYTAGLFYESGPWQASIAWWGGRNNDGTATAGAQNAPGRDRMDLIEIGMNYLLSPGIRLNAGMNVVLGAGQSKSEKADAWAFIFGTAFTF